MRSPTTEVLSFQGAAGCEAMDGCLICLAQEYPHVKFCRMPASAAGVSTRFVCISQVSLFSIRLTNSILLAHFIADVNCVLSLPKQKVTGLPALLVYKAGHLMGNFVRLIDEFGDDFYATDVEGFLIE